MPKNNDYIALSYNRYEGNSKVEIPDKIIAEAMAKYLRRYHKLDGRWTGINIRNRDRFLSDFFETVNLVPNRFYSIFRETDRSMEFLNYFEEFNVKAEIRYGFLSLFDLEH